MYDYKSYFILLTMSIVDKTVNQKLTVIKENQIKLGRENQIKSNHSDRRLTDPQ